VTATVRPCACGTRPCLLHYAGMSQAERARVQRSLKLTLVYPGGGR
jgi:hypothetical protein